MARRNNKANGVVKQQNPGKDQHLKAKFELAKVQAVDQCIPSASHPSSSTSFATNKQIHNNNMTTNLSQRTQSNRKNRSKKKATGKKVCTYFQDYVLLV